MIQLHIAPRKRRLEGDFVYLAARVVLETTDRLLWFRFPKEYAEWLTDSADPFLLACVLMGMRESADIVVHGPVSPSLIANLYEFQAAWHSWRPKKYDLVEISSREERENSYDRPSDAAVCAFTGGVDSCYTMYRHKKGLCGRSQRQIEAGLFVHGFDIPLEQPEAFERAASRARTSLNSLGVELLTVASNHKELNPEWDDTHGIGIASALMFFSPRFSEGLIASTYSYTGLNFPWGSNPVTDRLMSSNSFGLVHDGADCIRGRKYLTVSQWNEGYANLRVCFSAEEKDKNCGKCGKCIVTQLAIRRLQLPLPPSFERELTDEDILSLRNPTDSDMESLQTALDRSLEQGFGGTTWVNALLRCVRYNQKRRKLLVPSHSAIKEKLRKWQLTSLETAGP